MFEVVSPTILFGFCVIWLAAAMTPGANVAFTVSISSRYGFRAGLACAAGFVTGILVYSFIVPSISNEGLLATILQIPVAICRNKEGMFT